MQALKLFSGEAAQQRMTSADPRRDLTLRECYTQFLLPELQQHDKLSTLRRYETLLRWWEKLTDNPPIGTLDEPDPEGRLLGAVLIDKWQQEMAGQVGSPETIRSYRRNLTTILRRVGPYSADNPAAVGILKRLPHCRPPKAITGLPGHARLVPVQIWSELYRNSHVSQLSYDRRVPGPLATRVLWTAFYFAGARTVDCFLLQRENVSFDPRCPLPEWNVESPHGWLWFISRKVGKFHLIPLHEVFAQHLQALYRRRFGAPEPYHAVCRSIERFTSIIRRGKDPREQLGTERNLFPFGGARETEQKDWQVLRKNVQAAAGIEAADFYEYRDLRDACNMVWNRAHYPAGEWVLGHASSGVNETYYTVGIQYMLQALPKLEVPAAFADADL